MLKKFALWFVVFILSFPVSDILGLPGQGAAFFVINLSIRIICMRTCISCIYRNQTS